MFLQYLWGIETDIWLLQEVQKKNRFYSTYEELKHARGKDCVAGRGKFLQYLWGIETLLQRQYNI